MLLSLPIDAASAPTSDVQPTTTARLAWLQAPLMFEANQGQADSRFSYVHRGLGFSLLIASDETVVQSPDGLVRIGLAGANAGGRLEGVEPLPGRVHYLMGRDVSSWHAGIATYGKVSRHQVYDGIDLVYYGTGQQLEYDFQVAPGSDPRRIRLSITGAQSVALDASGDLAIRLGNSELRHHKPVVYQWRDDRREMVDCRFRLKSADVGGWEVGFEVASYDHSRPLVIDPVLGFSTYLGGSGDDQAFGLAVDSEGCIYVAGQTASLDFPATNTVRSIQSGGYDVFVAKFNPAGSDLVYATYLGGSGNDRGFHVAADFEGSAIVVGQTFSANFPISKPFQPNFAGGDRDGFIAKLTPKGDALVFSTYYGGSASDDLTCVSVDRRGYIYAGGDTSSTNFPTVKPFQPLNKGNFDAAIAKFSPDGVPVYSTYLGGSGPYDSAIGLTVNEAGEAFVTGYTSSSDFPTTNALHAKYAGGYDVFVSKLTAQGDNLVYSTFCGGSGDDVGRSIVVDQDGFAYVSGDTFSTNFPVVKALQSSNAGKRDVFVFKLKPAGSEAVYSTYWGGRGEELCGLAVDARRNVHLVGLTTSTNLPLVDPIQAKFGGGNWDAFAARISPDGGELLFSTYIGGESNDQGASVAIDPDGNTVIAGATASASFPLGKPYQMRNRGGNYDAFVAKIIESPKTTPPPPAAVPEVAAKPEVKVDAREETRAAAPAATKPASEAPFDIELLKSPLFNSNLVVNGDAEGGAAATSSYKTVPLPGWTTTQSLTVLKYGMPGGFPGTNTPGPLNRGTNFFVGGPDSPAPEATQTIDLDKVGAVIDAKVVEFKFSAFLGGAAGQKDSAEAQVVFMDASSKKLSECVLGPEAKGMLVLKTGAGTVPAGARKAVITLRMKRENGTYNDAVADNIAMVLTPTVAVK